MCRSLLLLVRKDLIEESRSLETVGTMAFLSVLISLVIGAGVQAAILPEATVIKLFPVCIWIGFVLAATVSVGRTHESETHHMAIERLLTSGLSPALLYTAKFFSNVFFIGVGHLVGLFSLALFLNVRIAPHLPQLLSLSILVIVAYTALSTLLVAIAQGARIKNLLLPLILLPLIFPLFFAAIEASYQIFNAGGVDYGSFWISLLIALDVVYFVAGLNLYEFVIRE